jgi:transcriptional regulator with XRE-family HTH domain
MQDLVDKRDRTQHFRERMETAMRTSGISRAALARAVGIDRSTVTQMLSGRDVRMPGGHVVAGIAATLGVSADWLLGLSDRPEQVGDLLATSLSMTEAGRATGTDDQIFAWHEEAAGYKIRHVPATLPDVLKTDGLMRWEYAPETVKTPGQAIAAAHARLEWLRGSSSDYEIALPVHELESFAFGTGYYKGLDPVNRREQLDWLITVYEQLYPGLRLFLYDARVVYSAPITVFGPRLAALYVGHHYVTFRDRERVRAMSRHFDWLVREAVVPDRDIVQHVEGLRAKV